MAHQVSDMSDFDSKLNEAGSNLVVVDFFATWCGPCKMIAPKIQELAAKYPDVVFLKVDVDDNEDIAAKYDIKSMPTFLFIKNKQNLDSFSGANGDKLEEMVIKYRN